MINPDQKLFECLEDAPINTKRFYLYMDSVARRDAGDDEMTALILGITATEVAEARADFKQRLEIWNQLQEESKEKGS